MSDEPTDFNLVVLCGQLTIEPEYRAYDSGARLIRFLVSTRSSEPLRRLDVVPVVVWDPPDELWMRDSQRLDRVIVIGTVQRRYWTAPDGRESRIEVVASKVEFSGSWERAA